VQIARAAYWRVLISETLESFRVKNAVVIVHITEKLSGEYACLTVSSNMLQFLREELTNLSKMVRSAFCLPIVDPQPKGALHAFGCVWEWSNNAHEAFPWVLHGRAILGR